MVYRSSIIYGPFWLFFMRRTIFYLFRRNTGSRQHPFLKVFIFFNSDLFGVVVVVEVARIIQRLRSPDYDRETSSGQVIHKPLVDEF